ncbi:hypothetical protein ACQ4PT_063460 [Festuca glaucescens]
MRMLGYHVQHSNPPEPQHNRLTVAHAQQLWNEWEIQCLVLVSFSLQVFLFFAGFRKRYRNRVLNMLLWLAYLLADTVAVFVLGRLTRVGGDDPLVLFWAPFMLLHLGGQETITAFSMEDCALWERHLLNLTTQVALAIYVVGKQWQGNKQLVAPMVLIFVSGTAKYVERIWILGRAGSWAPGSRPWGQRERRRWKVLPYTHQFIRPLFFSEKKSEFNIQERAINLFSRSMQFLMNLTPKRTSHWPYMEGKRGGCSPRIVLSIRKRLRPAPESIMEWSGKLQQFNLVDDTIQEGNARMGIKQHHNTTTKHVAVSLEVKKAFLEKLCEIATGPDSLERLAFTRFRAEELPTRHKLQPSSVLSATQQAVSDICKGMDLVSSALLWHLVTDIFLVSEDEAPSNSKFRTCSQHLSNYIMHLVSQCDLLLDTDGRELISAFIRNVKVLNLNNNRTTDKTIFIRRALCRDVEYEQIRSHDLFRRMDTVISEFLKSKVDPWEMTAMVWVEMLCYIACNCDHGFHTKQLSAGGEFLTHAKMLVFFLV